MKARFSAHPQRACLAYASMEYLFMFGSCHKVRCIQRSIGSQAISGCNSTSILVKQLDAIAVLGNHNAYAACYRKVRHEYDLGDRSDGIDCNEMVLDIEKSPNYCLHHPTGVKKKTSVRLDLENYLFDNTYEMPDII